MRAFWKPLAVTNLMPKTTFLDFAYFSGRGLVSICEFFTFGQVTYYFSILNEGTCTIQLKFMVLVEGGEICVLKVYTLYLFT